jgi:hypothetical protein
MLKNGYSHPSRRDFLGTAAGVGGAMLIGWWNAPAEGVDSRVAQVLSGKQVKKPLIA